MKRILHYVAIVLLSLTGPICSIYAAPETSEAASADTLRTTSVARTAQPSDGQGSGVVDPSVVSSATAALPPGEALPDTVGLITRMVLSLFAVIFLIWGAVQLLKRFSSGGTRSSGATHIRVLDRAYIAPKKSIYVVQIGDKALALGVSDQQMTTLTDLDLQDTLAQYADAPSTPVVQRFTDVLKTVNARFVRQIEEPAT